MSAIRFMRRCALAAAIALPGFALAGGPLNTCPGTGIKWPGTGTINLSYDQGVLGSRTKAASDALVSNAIALWTNVTTASVVVRQDPITIPNSSGGGSYLPVDVTPANFATYDMFAGNTYTFNGNPVIYDSDGSILESVYGVGASNSILGFAGSGGPCSGYTRGEAVLNGKPFLTNNLGQQIVLSDATMTTTIAHEVGHLIGLDHTQLNSVQGGISSSSNYPLMYPIAARTTGTLHEDDAAAITALYPDTTANSAYGQITGNFRTIGGVAINGANIFAQGSAGNFSVVSDFLDQGTGYFRLYVPPGTYTLHAGAIQTNFTGGSGVGPYSSDWNGASFQPPIYSGAGSTGVTPTGAMAIVTHPQTITITAGCVATVTFTNSGTGNVGGNCNVAPPATPTQISPNGSVSTTTPTYTWNGVSGAASYNLLVQNTSGVLINTSYTAAAAGCSAGGTCSVMPTTALVNGSSYNWFVNAVNAGGTSAWSSGLMITANTGPAPTPPAPPVTSSPNGTITTATPAYSWAASTGATSYYLLVQNTSGVVIGQTYTDSALGCVGGGTCTITPSTALTNGSAYNWFVNASNSVGTSAWSAAKSITVSTGPAPTVPAAPTTVTPTGTITTATPSYTWNAIAGVTSYELLAQNTAGVALDLTYTATAAGCAAGTGTCTVTPANALTNGAAYNWFVRATNTIGTGAWSAPRTITVTIVVPAPATPATVSPTGAITTTTPTYTWNASSGATSYTVQVTGSGGMVINTSYTSAQAACASTCSVMPSTALTDGQSYNWSVNATNSGGSSTFSAARAFNVAIPVGPTLPGAPVLVSPTGTVTTLAPTYTWNAISSATSYELTVQNTAGVAVNAMYSPSAVGCGAGTGTCSVTPGNALTNGSVYNWFVRATNSVGTGPWGGPITITVSGAGPSIPGAPTPIAPMGVVTTITPNYSWAAISGATSYYLLVQNTAGVAVSMSVTPAAAGCGAGTGTCNITPPGSLSNGAVYNWFVNATNSLGTGPWSAATTISISATGPSVPLAPVTISPTGTLATTTPTYTWNASTGATSYYFLVQNTAGVLIGTSLTASAVGCGAGTGMCTYTPSTALAAHATYNWFVNATNSLGTSPWSAARTITAP